MNWGQPLIFVSFRCLDRSAGFSPCPSHLKPFLLPASDPFPKQTIGFDKPILVRFSGMISGAGPGTPQLKD